MAEIVLLGIRDFRAAHQVLFEMFADDPEPMPGWSERDPVKLETCLRCTEVGAFGQQKYPDLVSKAAKLFYSGTKLHIFPNGNKRYGVTILLLFLIKNGQLLDAAPGELVYMATRVAAADPQDPASKLDVVIREIIDFLDARLEPDPQSGESGS